jgi:hypothetical protein
VNTARQFYPPRRSGLIFHAAAILFLLAASGLGLWQASSASIGPTFLIYLLPALISVPVIFLLAYRAYALFSASYQLERDGLRLRWGLRSEQIPMDALVWVGLARDFPQPAPLPRVHWPGAILGQRRLPDGRSAEYMAARSRDLVLIAAGERLYLISPLDPAGFLQAFHRLAELGSLTPLPWKSDYPAFLLLRVWRSRLARGLLLVGLIFNLAAFAWVSLAVPGLAAVALGFGPGREPVPSVRLLLLPIISILFYLLDFAAGLYYFRRGDVPPGKESLAPERLPASSSNLLAALWLRVFSALPIPGRLLAYILWSGGMLTGAIFLLAVLLIVGNS